MKKLIFLFLSIASLGAFAQTEPIAPEYIRSDSMVSFTNNEDIKLVGRGTGGVNIEGEYTLPKTDGDASEVLKTDGSGNITMDSVTFAELQGIDTVLTDNDTVSLLATQYDLTQIQGYTVTNSANNRVITSVDSENGNAEANLTFDGTDLNIVTGGLDIGGTEVISSGRAITGTSGTIQQGAANSRIDITSDTKSWRLLNDYSSDVFRLQYNLVSRFVISNTGEVTIPDLAGTGERITTATSTGELNTIPNGTDGQVMTMVSGSPAWADPQGNPQNGTYTPTLSNTTNLTSSTLSNARYTAIGDQVEVWVFISITPTGAGDVQFDLSLPIATNVTGTPDLYGFGSTGQDDIVRVVGKGSDDEAIITFTSTDGSPIDVWFNFNYIVR